MARPTSSEISAAIQIWQTSEPGSEGEREAASRMADLLRRFMPPACSDPAKGKVLKPDANGRWPHGIRPTEDQRLSALEARVAALEDNTPPNDWPGWKRLA